ncbi:MAG: FAD-binding oxidoreductase [Gemmataceae bacterium]
MAAARARLTTTRAGVAVVAAIIAAGTPAKAQISPEEHAKHHPGQAQGQPGQPAPGGMMGDMGAMMKEMHAPPAKELYPRLMSVPELTPAVRAEIERDSHERMATGMALLSQGLDQFTQATSGNDYSAMERSAAQMREGLARFESGLAGHRALTEGRAPRSVALQWFKTEMNLLSAPHPESLGGVLGLSWFHAFLMVGLIGFAAAMIWMYFHKMKRAALLLEGLTGGEGAPPSAASGPSQAGAPRDESAQATSRPATGRFSGALRVGRIFEETPDVKTYRLMNPLGGVLPFDFLPGQFLTVAVPSGGKAVKRSYTIASSPTQHDYAEITVKHEEGGVVSGHLHGRVKEGDLLECSGPSGSFIFTGRECRCILLIAGGVGITPMMSVLRYLTDRSWPGDIYLVYGIHSPRDFIFREELEYLGRRHPNLRVVVTASHPDGTAWNGQTGRITKELLARSVPDIASRYVHLCGPVPLMESVKAALLELGVPKERIKSEAFGPALGKPEPGPTQASAELPAGVALPTVRFSLSDKSAPLPPDKAVLEVADEIGVEIDNSCRVGTCGVCRVKLLAGEVTMAVEDGLEPGDREKRIILACQAKSKDNVTVEA